MTTAAPTHSRQLPDLNRAFALGTAIAINLAALGALAVMQPSWQPAIPAGPADNIIEAIWPEVLPEVPPVPPAPVRARIELPVPVPPIATAPLTPAPSEAAPVETASMQLPMESTAADMPGAAGGLETLTGIAADRDAGVALADPSPPPYPIASIRNREEGIVLLEVLVSASGAATEVRVLRGSGHRKLDQSAREHVLESWSFQPALRDGRPVAARVRVPIEFSLDTR